MNNPQQEMDYLCSQLDEFYAYWYPGKNKDNDQAKAVLTKVSKEIKSFPVEAKKQECFPVEFLDILTHIYFSLANTHYLDACNWVSKYIIYYPIDGRRSKNALVSVLEKFGF